jgi:hypothetical protein
MSALAVVVAAATPAFAASSIVGLSQDDLIACAGLPSGEMQTGEATYWQYGASRQVGSIQTFGQMHVLSSHSTGCEATVTLKGGVVSDVKTRGYGGLLTGPIACAKLFAACGR